MPVIPRLVNRVQICISNYMFFCVRQVIPIPHLIKIKKYYEKAALDYNHHFIVATLLLHFN